MQNPIDMRAHLLRYILASSIITVCLTFTASSQTIFTYGNQSVSKADFLKAYNKNNSNNKASEKSYRDYLDLYTRYKLKVRAAYDEKLDTLPSLIAELQNFRNQVADTYMHD